MKNVCFKTQKATILNNTSVTGKADVYDDSFYQGQMENSYKGAKKYAELLGKYYIPKSLIDIGCGRGTWLKAFKENGAEKLVGVDGAWNTQQNMATDDIHFYPRDLNQPISFPQHEKFDLAMSLEVAEHLEVASAITIVTSLTNFSDIVLFGAAYHEQGGTNHINEQPNTYWAKLFISLGYIPFDLFRPAFWGDDQIPFWYQQNTFLYIRKDSEAHIDFLANGIIPISNIKIMDCIHPDLYSIKLKLLEDSKMDPGFLANARKMTTSFDSDIKKLLRTK